MHIGYRTSLLRAQAILKLVEIELDHFHNDAELGITAMGYENGRESGVFLYCGTHTGIAWAEHRSSESIVVYVGPVHEFSGEGRVPSEELYETEGAKHYLDGEIAARDFIVAQIKSLIPAKPAKV